MLAAACGAAADVPKKVANGSSKLVLTPSAAVMVRAPGAPGVGRATVATGPAVAGVLVTLPTSGEARVAVPLTTGEGMNVAVA